VLRFLNSFFRASTDARVGRRRVSPAPGEDARFRAVSIRPGDGSCEAARQFGQMRFLCTKAPRLPVPECTAATCNCRYVHYSDRRTGRDRRRTYDWARERDLDRVNRRSGRGRRETDAVV
jgi:hypothetical protein